MDPASSLQPASSLPSLLPTAPTEPRQDSLAPPLASFHAHRSGQTYAENRSSGVIRAQWDREAWTSPPLTGALGSSWACMSFSWKFSTMCWCMWASQVVLVLKNLPASAEDLRDKGLIPGSGRSPGGGHGNPLQHSCRENPTDRGAWRATVREVAESDMTEVTEPTCIHVQLGSTNTLYIASMFPEAAADWERATRATWSFSLLNSLWGHLCLTGGRRWSWTRKVTHSSPAPERTIEPVPLSSRASHPASRGTEAISHEVWICCSLFTSNCWNVTLYPWPPTRHFSLSHSHTDHKSLKHRDFGLNPGSRNFPGGTMAKIPCSQCRGPAFHPWSGN